MCFRQYGCYALRLIGCGSRNTFPVVGVVVQAHIAFIVTWAQFVLGADESRSSAWLAWLFRIFQVPALVHKSQEPLVVGGETFQFCCAKPRYLGKVSL